MTPSTAQTVSTNVNSNQRCTLDICISCRPKDMPRGPITTRPGFILFQQVRDAIGDSPLKDHVVVRQAECLSVCPRPCGIAFSSPHRWTYLFGDQDQSVAATDIVKCVSLYLDSPDGYLPRSSRPRSMQGGILGRVPPHIGRATCT